MLLELKDASASAIALCVGALCVCYALIGAIVNYRRLSQFNGPPLAGFTSLYIFWQSINNRFNIAVFKGIKKYGSVYRIAPNLLITDDPEILRHISAARSQWTRSEWYTANKIDPRRDSVFSTRDDKIHTELRSKMMAAYNNRDIDSYEIGMDERILDFVDLIKSQYNDKPMDMAPLALFFTLDTLSTTAFGHPFGFLKANDDIFDYLPALQMFAPIMELCSNHPTIFNTMNSRIMRYLFAPRGGDQMGVGQILGFSQKYVAERFGPDPKVKRDMLGYMVNKGMPQEQVEVEGSLQIVAGSDSTATVLRTTLYQLIANPGAYAKLRAEIDAAVASGGVSFPVVTNTEAQSLPYLSACLWEGLRMTPPLVGSLSKVAPPGGETIKGIFFPEGTRVGICPAAVNRREDIFGRDAYIYHPDRWVNASEEERHRMEQATECIFGTGKYVCLGKNIAFMELSKTVVELIRHFDWAIANPLKGIESVNHGVFLQKNMMLRAWART